VLNLRRGPHGSRLRPDTPECRAAVGGADAALARLVDDLRARRWERSVVIVTADHGMTAVAPMPARPERSCRLAAELRRRASRA
jgi:predicted AlkP superfamily pyrophosphatase or phosphodiesterase